MPASGFWNKLNLPEDRDKHPCDEHFAGDAVDYTRRQSPTLPLSCLVRVELAEAAGRDRSDRGSLQYD